MVWVLTNAEAVGALVAVLGDKRGVRQSVLGRVYQALAPGGQFSLDDSLRQGLHLSVMCGLTRDEVVAAWRAAFPEAGRVRWADAEGGGELLCYETAGCRDVL